MVFFTASWTFGPLAPGVGGKTHPSLAQDLKIVKRVRCVKNNKMTREQEINRRNRSLRFLEVGLRKRMASNKKV